MGRPSWDGSLTSRIGTLSPVNELHGQKRTFAPRMAMYKYTGQATIQWAIPGLLRGPANAK